MKRFTQLFVLGVVLLITASTTESQTSCTLSCPSGTKDCQSLSLACSSCGLANCGTVGVLFSDKLDLCKSRVSMTCSVERDSNNRPVVCNNANQVVQCYTRNITTTGYRCSDGFFASFRADTCCKG